MVNWIIVHRVLEKYFKIWIIIITGRLKTLSKTWYCQLFWMRNWWNWNAKMTTTLNDILLIIFTEKQNGYRGLNVVPNFSKQDSADYSILKVVPKLPQIFLNKILPIILFSKLSQNCPKFFKTRFCRLFSLLSKTATWVSKLSQTL